MCVDCLRDKLAKAELEGTLPKVVIPVHLAGSSCDMKSIGSLSDRYGFKVIEDASHAIGGSYRDSPVGSCSHSSITVFSFHPVKIITTAEGGLATTNDPLLAQRMADLRSHGIVKDNQRFRSLPAGPWSYEQQLLGFNYRMNDLQAALGLSQLDRLDDFVKVRNDLYRHYSCLLDHLPVRLLEIPSYAYSALHLAVVRLNNTRPEFHLHIFNCMRSSNIGVQLHYEPVHLQPYYQSLGFKKGDFPYSESYATNSFSLPLYPGLSLKDQQYVVDVLAQLL